MENFQQKIRPKIGSEAVVLYRLLLISVFGSEIRKYTMNSLSSRPNPSTEIGENGNCNLNPFQQHTN